MNWGWRCLVDRSCFNLHFQGSCSRPWDLITPDCLRSVTQVIVIHHHLMPEILQKAHADRMRALMAGEAQPNIGSQSSSSQAPSSVFRCYHPSRQAQVGSPERQRQRGFDILASAIHLEQINVCNRLGPIGAGVPPMLAQGRDIESNT